MRSQMVQYLGSFTIMAPITRLNLFTSGQIKDILRSSCSFIDTLLVHRIFQVFILTFISYYQTVLIRFYTDSKLVEARKVKINLGGTKKDQVYLVLEGLDQVDFGTKDMIECLEGQDL